MFLRDLFADSEQLMDFSHLPNLIIRSNVFNQLIRSRFRFPDSNLLFFFFLILINGNKMKITRLT